MTLRGHSERSHSDPGLKDKEGLTAVEKGPGIPWTSVRFPFCFFPTPRPLGRGLQPQQPGHKAVQFSAGPGREEGNLCRQRSEQAALLKAPTATQVDRR